VARERDSLVQQRLVFDDANAFDAAGGRNDRFGLCVVDACCKLLRGEAAKHDRVHRTKSSACEHSDDGLGDHWHVEQDAVALGDTVRGERACEERYLVAKLPIRVRSPLMGDRTIVDQRSLVAALCDVPVEGVVTGVELGSGEPPIVRRVGVGENTVPASDPVNSFRHFAPEAFWVFE